MITVNRFIKKLNEILSKMEIANLRKVRSTALHRARKNNFKITKSFIRDLIATLRGLDKVNLSITDLPNNEARFIFKDLTEGNIVVDSKKNQIILGALI
nr:hypothetical protein [uncultured Fusobacterium sp.]